MNIPKTLRFFSVLTSLVLMLSCGTTTVFIDDADAGISLGGGNAGFGGGAASSGGGIGAGGAMSVGGGSNMAGGTASGGGTGVAGGTASAGGAAMAGGSASGGGAGVGGGTASGGGNVTPGTTDNAIIVSHTLPATLMCSQMTTVTVTVRNTGDTTWTAAGNYRLGAVGDSDPFFSGSNRILLAPGDSVAPGQQHTFSIQLRATPTGGMHTTDWRMVHDGIAWFGGIAGSNVNVACVVLPPGTFYPCVIDGQFGMPEHDQRIASRNVSLLKGGHTITGNDAIDNAVLMGGPPDGGIWLAGTFHFEVDATGQIIASASWITVFGPGHNTVTGGIYPNGEIHMGSPAGLDISGLITNGMISGFVAEAGQNVTRNDAIWNALSVTDRNNLRGIWHGNDLEYVHGMMSGTWTAR